MVALVFIAEAMPHTIRYLTDVAVEKLHIRSTGSGPERGLSPGVLAERWRLLKYSKRTHFE
jgi:hypothetical protein